LLVGEDVVLLAQCGYGKTAVFLLVDLVKHSIRPILTEEISAVEVLEVAVANVLAEGREKEGSITLIISPLSAIEKD